MELGNGLGRCHRTSGARLFHLIAWLQTKLQRMAGLRLESSKIVGQDRWLAWRALSAITPQRDTARFRLRLRFLERVRVLFQLGIAHPVVADFTASPSTAHQACETLGRLRDQAAEVMTDGLLAFLADTGTGRTGLLGDNHEAAHMRQSAGDGFDGVNLDFLAFYPTVSPILRFAGKRGEPIAAMRWASARAVGCL